MLTKQILKRPRFAAPLAIAIGLIIMLPGLIQAQETAKTCSNARLIGTFAFTIQGTLAIPGGTVQDGSGMPIRGLALTHFDGKGNLTQVDHAVVNGVPPAADWTPGSGTYSINTDCTGTAVIDSGSYPVPLNIHLIVSRHGTEVQQVVDANAVTALGELVQ